MNHAALQRRHVLHVCHSYYPPFLDVARQYCALFPRDQWAITTVFLTGEHDARIGQQIGSDDVIFLEHASSALRGLKLGQIRELRAIARARPFEFAIAHRHKALYICTHIPGLFVIGVQHRPGGYRRWSRRFYVRRHRQQLALLGVSNAVRDNMRRALPDFEPARIETLYNHIDVDAVRAELVTRDAARTQLGLPAQAYVFGNVGRLHPDKDQATLIRAFAAIRPDCDAWLAIVGKGRLESELKQVAAQLGVADRVIFTGPIAEARRYFRAFDSFVLSSDREPFGMVLLEAMAADLPIVATNGGGAPEVLAGIGKLFEVGDVAALAPLMRELFALSPETIAQMRIATAQRLNEHFSDAAIAHAFWQLPMLREHSIAR
ncbi:glycosyltransferase, putative [Ricinus communis]|uniref:Glycosyltransferase, putative n=1 Tax=Ricinus communis TaxID=3988 RepID=B9TD52_RICCO|nr:glycosyltransferase, putative [Ricinus communis]